MVELFIETTSGFGFINKSRRTYLEEHIVKNKTGSPFAHPLKRTSVAI